MARRLDRGGAEPARGRPGMVAWGLAGLVGLAVLATAGASVQALYAGAAEDGEAQRRPPLTVETMTVVFEPHHLARESFVGRAEPARETRMAFERAGLVTAIAVEEGDSVAAGHVLADLDARPLRIEQRRLRADREALEADIALAEATTRRRQSLVGEGWASRQALDEARFSRSALVARRDAVDAALEQVALDLEKSRITAPFVGRVAARHVDEGSVVAAGTAVLTLQEEARPLARIGVPPDRAASLALGQPVAVLYGDQRLEGQVARKVADLETATRTVPVLVSLPPSPAIASGEVLRLELRRPVLGRGAWLPLAALSEAERGLWSVMTVRDGADGPIIGREAVEILHTEGDRAFVRGSLTEGARVVVAGPHRLTVGQRIVPIAAVARPGMEG